MGKILRYLLYALAIFVSFLMITWLLDRNKGVPVPENTIFGLFSPQDIMIGLGVTAFVIFTRIKRENTEK